MSRIIVAMSGGVDSTAAAWLLKCAGHDITGVTLELFDNDATKRAIDDAAEVCRQLDIKHQVLDVKKTFDEKVVEPFCQYYHRGLTPSPCLKCNPRFKWSAMLDRSSVDKDTCLATGHYAGIVVRNDKKVLRRGKGKDQSYFLHRLTSDHIARSVFPVGDIPKDRLREMVIKEGLHSAHRPDSQEVCFIKGAYTDFLDTRLGRKHSPGNIIDLSGNVRGQHKGLHHYTVGQRSGLGIAAPRPLYVIRIDTSTNQLVVGEKDDSFIRRFSVANTVWSGIETPTKPIECLVQVRFRHPPLRCIVTPGKDRTSVEILDEKGAVIAPGQGAAFYDDDIVLGGGEILYE